MPHVVAWQARPVQGRGLVMADPGTEIAHMQVLMERRRTARAKLDEFIVDPDERARVELTIEQLDDDIAKAEIEVEVSMAMVRLERADLQGL